MDEFEKLLLKIKWILQKKKFDMTEFKYIFIPYNSKKDHWNIILIGNYR